MQVSQDGKILVKWSNGRWNGTTSLVKMGEVKNVTTAVGEKDGVTWGKLRKMYNEETIVVVGGVHFPRVP